VPTEYTTAEPRKTAMITVSAFTSPALMPSSIARPAR
jgi:hypothetical protein